MDRIKTTSIRLPIELWKGLKQWSLDHEITVQDIIQDLVRGLLERGKK